jgi:formylglycine-generating enzyme required for sulfatase activity
MGSENSYDDEKPVHTVYVDGFQIGKYEVTNRQYYQCVKARICIGTAYGEGRGLHPVVSISWYDAKTYCEWVGGRLPTEAEWEKAASWNAETQTKFVYPWGDTIDCSLANYKGDCDINGTTEVGVYESGKSPYDAYDLAGNVWEWTADWYDEKYYSISPLENPLGPDSGSYRVLRGGSWTNGNNDARSALRFRGVPSVTHDSVGFRCACDLP